MAPIQLVPDITPVVGVPQWIIPALNVTAGRDPLGMQTITIDRIIPQLVPGVLALSRRARYLSYYAFLLEEYREQRLPASNRALSDFIRAREYEYALAVQLCPRGCGSMATGVVGKQNAGPAARRASATLSRGLSVDSYLGGYGLYYRTPLIELDLIAPAGSLLGDTPTPIDLLVEGRAAALAQAFRDAVAPTAYYREHMRGIDPIPREILVELAEHACLCRLGDAPHEQTLLHQVLFTPSAAQEPKDVTQRRRSFALLLSLVDTEPSVAISNDAFRDTIWEQVSTPVPRTKIYNETLAQWAALAAKEYLQEGLSTIWAAFCQSGLVHQGVDGLEPTELDHLLHEELVGSGMINLPSGGVPFEPMMSTALFSANVTTAFASMPLEVVREYAISQGSAVAGLALIFTLLGRLPDPGSMPRTWEHIGRQHSDYQPGLLGFVRQLMDHMAANPSLGETIAWLVRRFVLVPHESIAYSKLPDRTFRFRWEQGRLRFYDLSPERFGLTDIRRDAMTWISEDLGLLTRTPTGGEVTSIGQLFVTEVLG